MRFLSSNSVTKSSPAIHGLAKEAPAQIPVFMLPHRDLPTVPEEKEFHEVFVLKMALKPHNQRRFLGLMSLYDIEKSNLAQSAMTNIKFKSYACIKPARNKPERFSRRGRGGSKRTVETDPTREKLSRGSENIDRNYKWEVKIAAMGQWDKVEDKVAEPRVAHQMESG